MKQRFAGAILGLNKWITGGLALISIAAYVLLQTGLIEDWKYLIPLAILVLCGMFVMVADITSKLNRIERNAIQYLQAPNKLHSLSTCQKSLRDELKQVRHKRTINIHHLGLDMASAWQELNLLIKSTAKSKASGITVKLLMFTDDISELCIRKPPPAELRFIAAKSKGQLRKIRHDMQRLKAALGKVNKRFSFQVRLYAEVPVIHGFALKAPHRKHYLSFGRWVRSDEGSDQASEWDWGGNKYRMIAAPDSDAVLTDEALMFDEFFNHLWKHASREAFDSSSPSKEGSGGR